jgi:hypothetical protein
MLHVAARWPLTEWGRGAVDTVAVFADQAHAWSLQGVRPANHPRTRLAQYAAWSAARPDWPVRLAAMAKGRSVRFLAGSCRRERATRGDSGKFTALRALIGAEICADGLGGTRLDNLICDGFLPLWAARAEEVAAESVHRWRWQHWFPGDLPPFVSRSLRELGVFGGVAQPACHGAAQGLLGWWLARENRR